MTGTLFRARDRTRGEGVAGSSAHAVPWLGRAAIVAMLVLGGGVAAFTVAMSQPAVYAARSEILYETGAASTSVLDRNLATQQALLRSRAVLGPVAEDSGLSSGGLDEAVTVEQIGSSEMLQLTVEHSDPQEALRIAQQIVERYVARVSEADELRGGQAAELLTSEMAALEEELVTVEEQITALEEEHRRQRAEEPAAPLPPELGRLQREAQSLGQRIANLDARLTDHTIEQLGEAKVTVVTQPYLLEELARPRPLESAAAGALVGLTIGAAVLFLLSHIRPAPDEAGSLV